MFKVSVFTALFFLASTLLNESAFADTSAKRREATAAGPSLATVKSQSIPKNSASSKIESPDSEPPIRAGAAIVAISYNEKKRQLTVRISAEPAVGPNITTPEYLVDAIGIIDSGDRKAFIDNPKRFIGTEYVLQKDLKLLVPEF